MLSRQQCENIATCWVIDQGIREYARRCEAVARGYLESAEKARAVGQPFKVNDLKRIELDRSMAKAVLDGYYDPPWPKLPGFFARLRMNDWTPPMPTPDEWPMGSAHREDAACLR